MEELFEMIREQAGKEIWSRAVELARQDSVSGDHSEGQERVLRVLDRSRGVSAIVHLWLEDCEWSKDCFCNVDPCAHVGAAIIALKRAEEKGLELPQSKTAGAKLSYALTRKENFIHFERYVVLGDDVQVLNVPLTSIGSGRLHTFAVSPSKDDLAIEIALGSEKRGRISTAAMQKIWPYLFQQSVTLDGQPITLLREALGLTIVIRDEGLGIFVIGKKDARILETFHNGLVLSAEGLHPQLDLNLEPDERDMLQRGRIIALRDLESFASERLPTWESRFKVENTAKNLPHFVDCLPELELTLERHGHSMLVNPGIIYGRPPIARISDGVFRSLGNTVPYRDRDEERRLKDQLWRHWGLELYTAKVYDTAQAIAMVKSLKTWQGSIKGEGVWQFKNFGPLKAELQWQPGQLDIRFSGDEESGQTRSADPRDVLAAWDDRRPLVPLFEGGFAELPSDWLAQYGETLRAVLRSRGQDADDTPLPKELYAQISQLFNDEDRPEDLKLFKRLEAWQGHDPKLPGDMVVELRPYQLEGVSWLQDMQKLGLGALLADDMGLGKTVQSLAALHGASLIIAPTSVLPNWKKELKRFRPQLVVHLYHGSDRQWREDADVIISSYGLLRQDSELFQNRSWQTIVLDEAQTIKNPDSKIAQAAQALRGDFRIALSGTPVENRLEDLWSIFAFLNPGLLGARRYFRDQWSKPIEDGDAKKAQHFQKILKPFFKRRLKKDVALDLPPRIEKPLYAELWPEERKLYRALQAATRDDVVKRIEAGASIFEALEALLRMRQACCHPALIPSQEALSSSKLTLLLESLETILAEGHKALIFSQWTGLLDLLEPLLETANMPFLRLDGRTKDRQSIVDQFQHEQGPPLLIMSLKAGGVGLNLTRADHVYILDPWWNPAAADQAADRTHRIGQDRPVMIHQIIALDTVEEKIMELQAMKRSFASAALGEGSSAQLNREDILNLLRDA